MAAKPFFELQRRAPELPVVISSGVMDEETVQSLLAAGARAFLKKPYDARQLSRVVSRTARPRGDTTQTPVID